MRTITVYSLAPICHRCKVMDPRVERVSRMKGLELRRKNFGASMWYLFRTMQKPPVILLDENVISKGEIISEKQLSKRIL